MKAVYIKRGWLEFDQPNDLNMKLLKMRIGLVISNDVIKKYEVKELYNLIKSNYEISYIFSEKKEKKLKIKIFKIFEVNY